MNCQQGSHIPLHLTSGRRQAPVTPCPPESAHLRGIEECVGIVQWRASYQDVLVLSVSGLVFGRESLPCTGLLKDLAD